MHLNQVTLPATGVERSAAFYRMLGFRQIVSNYPHYARFECPDGGSTFSLHSVTSVVTTDVIVYFECEDLESQVARLEALGVAFDGPPVDQSWLWREAYLRDPDGNLLCFYHAGANRRFPPWRMETAAGE